MLLHCRGTWVTAVQLLRLPQMHHLATVRSLVAGALASLKLLHQLRPHQRPHQQGQELHLPLL